MGGLDPPIGNHLRKYVSDLGIPCSSAIFYHNVFSSVLNKNESSPIIIPNAIDAMKRFLLTVTITSLMN
jgi:hypothetical protein